MLTWLVYRNSFFNTKNKNGIECAGAFFSFFILSVTFYFMSLKLNAKCKIYIKQLFSWKTGFRFYRTFLLSSNRKIFNNVKSLKLLLAQHIYCISIHQNSILPFFLIKIMENHILSLQTIKWRDLCNLKPIKTLRYSIKTIKNIIEFKKTVYNESALVLFIVSYH